MKVRELMKHNTSRVTEREKAQRIYTFLKQQQVGTLATVDPNGEPHGAVIYFFIEKDFTITFATKNKTKKYDNLSHKNHAMLVVYEPVSQTTVQITATTEEIQDDMVAQQVYRQMLNASMNNSISGMPPVAKIDNGNYAAIRLTPLQMRMAVFARPDPEGVGMYESLEFDP